MIWLGEKRGEAVDWVTQRWVQLTGRRFELATVPWLEGPCGAVRGIGADFFERWGADQGLSVLSPDSHDGLFSEGLEALRGPTFEPAEVDSVIDAFYARTSAFDLQIESRWSGPFRAVGWLIAP